MNQPFDVPYIQNVAGQTYGTPYQQPRSFRQGQPPVYQAQYEPPIHYAPVPHIVLNGKRIYIPVFLVLAIIGLVLLSLAMQALWLLWVTLPIAVGTVYYLFAAPYAAFVKPHMTASAILAVTILIIAVLNTIALRADSQNTRQTVTYERPRQMRSIPSSDDNSSLISPSTPTPTAAPTQVPTQNPTIQPTATVRPTATPNQNVTHDGVAVDMTLYYNTDGGSYYHTTDRCSAINEKYLPLKGTITYSRLDESKFKRLKPCTSCSAPVRPHSH